MLDQPRAHVDIALNCIAKQRAVDFWRDMKVAPNADLQKIARRILCYWYEEKDGDLVPLVNPDGDNLVPDEVVITTPQGKVLARWTIVDEFKARFEQEAA